MQLLSCCVAFWGYVYIFAMLGSPGDLMTRENLFLDNDIISNPLMGMLQNYFKNQNSNT